jgi:hypothetical protein
VREAEDLPDQISNHHKQFNTRLRKASCVILQNSRLLDLNQIACFHGLWRCDVLRSAPVVDIADLVDA